MFVDEDRGYRAVASRDPRFDGQFILAVRTTGIYCRPSCPATTPKRRNVEFYATAAAAQAAGYRACRRCLPDAVPGSPEWNLRADLAGRAMRLISDGIVEREGVTGLATRLGYSERHVTRMLTAELGASPLALARAHRAHSARLLIETTTLSFADVAFAAGFASIRQFNDTIRAVFAATPTQLRVGAKRHRPLSTAGKVNLRLAFRQPFDGTGILDFLKSRAVNGVEDASENSYARTLRLPHGTGTARMHPSPDHIDCTLRLSDMRDLGSAVARLRRLFDMDADPCAIDELLSTDPALEPSVLKTPGIRVPGSVDGPEIVLRALIGQQISVAAARTALSRLASALGERLEVPDGSLTTLFPTPEVIAEHGAEVLTGPRKRIETIIAVSSAIASGSLDVHVGADPDELTAALESFSGIGPWTSGYVKMRVLGSPDILLPGDVALRKGALKLGIADLATRSAAWAPWRSYAGMHLWRADSRES
ncbi:AlkA N-terminal domain-containing protein [Kibdelosporangium aridum]|uniref:DNA-3-methyladenine glycosylase II n=1 Tax=Kibdelosporangium aridum TaxID=2030 RepID=A0A1Y5XSX0_KIBAR|nr:AlkA N-terminal domain-containing protein [Kibdelosporangium aridum]SMD15673.1 DNA-3-methyladenine glycosylase II [Kibdelosporangium aridum]